MMVFVLGCYDGSCQHRYCARFTFMNTTLLAHEQAIRKRKFYLARMDAGMCAGGVSGAVFGAIFLGSWLGESFSIARQDWVWAAATGAISGMLIGLILGMIMGMLMAALRYRRAQDYQILATEAQRHRAE